MNMSEYKTYRIQIHQGTSGSGWWCQESIQLPMKGIDWDDEDLHSILQYELLPKMMAVLTSMFGPTSDWEHHYGGEEE